MAETVMRSSIFAGANLVYADLSHAVITDADFSSAELNQAKMHETYDENVIWSGSTRSQAQGTDQTRLKAEQWDKS